MVLGYGQDSRGAINAQARNRCDAAVRLYLEGRILKIFLTVSAQKNGVYMADGMREYLLRRGVPKRHIIFDLRGANTAGEMDIFLTHRSAGEKVIFVSTWYHIPRITWLAAWRMSWKDFSTKAAWRHAHFVQDFLVEFLKIANAVLRPRKSAKTVLSPVI